MQKTKANLILIVPLMLIAGVVYGILGPSQANAVTIVPSGNKVYPPGTCFVLVQGSSQKVGPCNKVAKGIITNTQLKKLEPKKCYSISAGLSSQNVAETNCDGKGQTGAEVKGSDGCSSTDPNFSPDPALCGDSTCDTVDNCNLTKKYLNPIINKLLAPLALLAVIVGVIWGSIEYTTSGGDPQRVASAKGHIQKALIALLAFIFLYAFLQWLLPGGLI